MYLVITKHVNSHFLIINAFTISNLELYVLILKIGNIWMFVTKKLKNYWTDFKLLHHYNTVLFLSNIS